MHSVKNRFLLRVKNMDSGTYLRFFIPITLRDTAALLYIVIHEWSTIPGIPKTIRALPSAWAWRKVINLELRQQSRKSA